jgi:glucose/arabinose dehydrogenase
MRRAALGVACIALALTGLTAAMSSSRAGAAPPQLTNTLVASVPAPTALAFTPDGRILVTTQPGQLRVLQNDALVPTPALNISSRVCTQSERGMLGVAVDPAFASNHFVYLFFTLKGPNGECGNATAGQAAPPNIPYNHVARFVLGDDNVATGETTIIDKMPSYNGNHNGGDVVFGPDGKLYVSVGDGGCDLRGGGCQGANDVSRDIDVGIAKILRVNADGSIPSDNPYAGESTNPCGDDGFTDPGKHCPETWAQGFRNPFRMAFGPNGKLYVNDVGQAVWEEIDDITPGADYGWNTREGPCVNGGSGATCGAPSASGLTNPIHAYQHGGTPTCDAITGGAFVPSGGTWPADYQGDYLFADYGCGKIFRLEPQSGGGFAQDDLVTNLGENSAVHMEFGPDQALYFTTYAGGGAIRKLAVTTTPPSSTSTSTTTTTPSTTPPTTAPPTTAPPAGTVYLSSLNPASAQNGLGPFERDRHNGGSAANDGGPLVVGGITYPRGLGVYPRSSLTYNLAKQYTTFRAKFGIDDSCGNAGSVRVEVHRVIGTQQFAVAASGTLTGASAPFDVNVDMRNADKLILYVLDVASNGSCARADWADARLTRVGTTPTTTTPSTTSPPSTTTTTRPPSSTTAPPVGTTYLSSLTPLSAKNGLGPVERDRHNGGAAAGDGGPLVVGGTTYVRGLGVYPRSTLTYDLAKQYSSFRAVFGIDDSCGSAGSVRIEVHRVIGTQDFAVASSGTLTGASAPFAVNVDVRNGDKLILHVIDVASNGACARSDWADARLLR